jgi:hypothetical protein
MSGFGETLEAPFIEASRAQSACDSVGSFPSPQKVLGSEIKLVHLIVLLSNDHNSFGTESP